MQWWVGWATVLLMCVGYTCADAQPPLPPPPPTAVLGDPGGVLGPLAQPPVPDGPPGSAVPIAPPIAPRRPAKNVGALLGVGLLAARNGYPGYSATWIPGQHVENQATDLGLVRQELSLFTPPSTVGPDTASLAFGIRNTNFYGTTILPTSMQPFPSQLWDVAAGVAYSHEFDNRWTLGAVVSAGSASDKPFENNTLNGTLFTYLSIPRLETDAWIFSLYYSPTSDFPYPIPGIAYYYNPNDSLMMNIGVPFFVKWKPTSALTFDLFYFPVRTVTARATWEVGQYTSVYAGYNWSNEGYFLADRANRDDRLYAYEMRLTGGLRFNLPWSLQLDISAGWVFDRFYFQGRNYSDHNNDRINVEPGPFGAISLRYKF